MEQRAQDQQIQVNQHKKYFLDVINDHRIILISTLVPAFLWGWKIGRAKWPERTVKQWMRVILFASYTQFKRQLLPLALSVYKKA